MAQPVWPVDQPAQRRWGLAPGPAGAAVARMARSKSTERLAAQKRYRVGVEAVCDILPLALLEVAMIMLMSGVRPKGVQNFPGFEVTIARVIRMQPHS